jgi:hypothetical protein
MRWAPARRPWGRRLQAVALTLRAWADTAAASGAQGCTAWAFLGPLLAVGMVAAAWRAARRSPAAPTLVLAPLCLVYAALVVASSAIGRLDAPDRLLAPLFIPAVVLVAGLARRAASRFPPVAPVALVLAVLWLVGSTRRTAAEVEQIARTGRMGFTSREWRESDLVARVRSRPSSAVLLSNAPAPLSLWTRRAAALPPAGPGWGALAGRAVEVAWFAPGHFPPGGWEPPTLPLGSVVSVERADDGALLTLAPSSAPPPRSERY